MPQSLKITKLSTIVSIRPCIFLRRFRRKKKVWGEVFMLWWFTLNQHLPLHLRKEHQPSPLSGPHCSKIPSKRQVTGSQTFLQPVRANTCEPTVRAGNLLKPAQAGSTRLLCPSSRCSELQSPVPTWGPAQLAGSSRTARRRHPILRWQKMGLMLLRCHSVFK